MPSQLSQQRGVGLLEVDLRLLGVDLRLLGVKIFEITVPKKKDPFNYKLHKISQNIDDAHGALPPTVSHLIRRRRRLRRLPLLLLLLLPSMK